MVEVVKGGKGGQGRGGVGRGRSSQEAMSYGKNWSGQGISQEVRGSK